MCFGVAQCRTECGPVDGSGSVVPIPDFGLVVRQWQIFFELCVRLAQFALQEEFTGAKSS